MILSAALDRAARELRTAGLTALADGRLALPPCALVDVVEVERHTIGGAWRVRVRVALIAPNTTPDAASAILDDQLERAYRSALRWSDPWLAVTVTAPDGGDPLPGLESHADLLIMTEGT